MSRATTATIHVDALRHNLAQVRALAPHSRVMAVVKADGYGHGLERVAHALEGADAFGVAALSDAERLRAAGLSQRIVLLSGIDEPADLTQLRRLGVDTVVHHESQLAMLEADPSVEPIRVWLKFDTGMHRLGFAPARAREIHARLRALPPVDSELNLMTHLASAHDVFDQWHRQAICLHRPDDSIRTDIAPFKAQLFDECAEKRRLDNRLCGKQGRA